MPTRILLACGVVGPALFVTVFTVEGALRPYYDPMRQPVSLLSLGTDGWLQAAAFLASGLLLLGFAVGLRRVLEDGRGATGAPIAVGGIGGGLLLAGLFSADPSFGYPPGAPAGIGPAPSGHAYVHVIGAFLLFGGLVIASWIFAARFRAADRGGWSAYSLGSGILVLTFLAASSGRPDGLPFFPGQVGLFQRISICVGLGWLAVIATGMLSGAIESGRLVRQRQPVVEADPGR